MSLLLRSGLRATANYYGACKFVITVFLLPMDNFNKEGVEDVQRRHQRSICNSVLTSKTKGVHVVSCDTIITINKLQAQGWQE